MGVGWASPKSPLIPIFPTETNAMRRTAAYPGPHFLSIFLLASTALHAQAPAAGTTVSVKMIDTVNSSGDPAGKQYRASVTKAVDAGNGVTIPQGAAATVTLTSSGADYAAQLSSITINGQAVAVTSDSATVSAVAQYAASKAASAVGSVLGGLGHHVSAPAAVAAAATGQHVSLPTGTTLTFVLGVSPASNQAASATSAPAPTAQPMEASAAPAPSPAASSAPGPSANGRYVYCYTGHPAWAPTNSYTSATEPVTYFSEIFPETIDYGLHVSVDWNNFLQQKSLPHAQAGCDDAIGLSAAQTKKQQKQDEYRKENKQVVETGWKFNPADDSAASQASAAAASPVAATAYNKECTALFGIHANEHCAAAANEYYVYCSGGSPDSTGPRYFSDVFAFNKDVSPEGLSADLAPSFLLFLETKYGVKASSEFYPTNRYTGGAYPTACSSSLTPLSWAQHEKQVREDNATKNLHQQIVETGWKPSIAPLPPVTRPPAAANEYYVSCYSDTALPVQYFSEIFAAVPAGDSIANAFFAFLQKKYGFNDPRPGPPVTCDVSGKPANAYMFQTAWAVRQNRENTGVEGKKSIETGWKYTP
jgi:hypothetical protein